jgi:hypothetical protein
MSMNCAARRLHHSQVPDLTRMAHMGTGHGVQDLLLFCMEASSVFKMGVSNRTGDCEQSAVQEQAAQRVTHLPCPQATQRRPVCAVLLQAWHRPLHDGAATSGHHGFDRNGWACCAM